MAAKVKKQRTQARCLPWYGSGATVSEYHAGLLGGCGHVTVLFGGGMSIEQFLVKTARTVIVNDKHDIATIFYRTISNPHKRQALVEDWQQTPFTESLLRESQDYCKRWCADDADACSGFELSRHYFRTAWMARSESAGTDSEFKGKLAFRMDGGGGGSSVRFQSAARSIQEVWGPVCARCEFLNRDWRDVLPLVKDAEGMGAFIDAPWHREGQQYTCKFTPQDHVDLELGLRRFEHTKIVVRYGDCAEARTQFRDARWHIQEILSRNGANGDVAELCITNFEVPS